MAITYTEEFLTNIGDRMFGLAKCTHDASATTLNLPCGQIDMANVVYGTAGGTTGTTVSWSGSTLTFSAAKTSGTYVYVYWIGV